MLPPRRVLASLPSLRSSSQFQWTGRSCIARSQTRTITVQQLDNRKDGRERVVILGSGWAGFSLARNLNPQKYQVIVVSPRSYFAFTPLLASTSVGTLEFRTALEPVRPILKRGSFFQGWADGIDFDSKTLTIEEAVEDPRQAKALTGDPDQDSTPGNREERQHVEVKEGQLFDLTWDKLVIAVGCYAQTFNTKGVKENAYFLKDVGDARMIRNRILSCFEAAGLPTTSEETKKQLLNFAVVGGGPTGIEWSAELHDIIREDMKRLYPELVEYARITIYDVAPKVLSMFDEKLSKFAMDHFKREGIDIKTSHHIEELRRGVPGSIQSDVKDSTACYTLKLKEEGEIGVGMVVWSTGLMMNPFVEKVLADQVKRDQKTGGLLTNDSLLVQRKDGSVIPNVFALGDCAQQESAAYPATAQVASQKATWLAKRLNAGDVERQKFTYKNLGIMAYVGNWNAILQSGGGGDISGRVAFVIWRSAYLVKSLSWRNRILIPIYWLINWIFGRDISRF